MSVELGHDDCSSDSDSLGRVSLGRESACSDCDEGVVGKQFSSGTKRRCGELGPSGSQSGVSLADESDSDQKRSRSGNMAPMSLAKKRRRGGRSSTTEVRFRSEMPSSRYRAGEERLSLRQVMPARRASCLTDCFTWAYEALSILRTEHGSDALHQRFGCRDWRLSTHFSGIGTVDVALDMIRSAIPRVTRGTLTATIVAACERSKPLRDLLVQRTQCCVFGDLFERIQTPSGRKALTQKNVQHPATVVANAAICFQHGQSPCKIPRANLNISGSSCRPWSKATRGAKGLDHEDAPAFFAWARLIRQDQPALVVHENVVGFDGRLLVTELGDLYDVELLKVSPKDAGFGFISRDRVYHVLARRGKVRLVGLGSVYDLLRRGLATDVSDWGQWVWRASASELESEYHGRCGANALGAETDWSAGLTAKQRQYLKLYLERWQTQHGRDACESPRCIFDLGDSPSYKVHGGNGLNMPTVRRRVSPWWSPAHRRWMLPREKAAAMGFPVYPDLAAAARVGLDSLTQDASAVGNAMHVANVGLVMVAVMFSAEWCK